MTPISISTRVCVSMAIAATWAVLSVASAAGDVPRLFDTWVGFDAGNYTTARYTYAGTAGDFDNDGDVDIATASYPNIPRVTVLYNNGDGTYAQPVVHAIPDASYELITADVTGDGFLDIIAANTNVNWFGTSVSILRNNASGETPGFFPAQSYPTGTGPVGLAAADFDGDLDVDLAVANWGYLGQGSTVSLLRNNGDGTFAEPLAFPAGASPFRLAVADFNNDGRPDLAVANGRFNSQGTAQVNVLFNDGKGGFEGPLTIAPIFVGNEFFPCIAAADLELDGDIDILFSHTGLSAPGVGYSIARINNNGDGTFAPPQPISLHTFSGGAVAIDVRDVTGNGWPDVLGVHMDNEGWSVIPGVGNGLFGPARRYPSGEAPMDVLTADVDRDGDYDPIIINRDSLEVCVHVNPGDGTFLPSNTFNVEPLSLFLDHGDLEHDGDLDLVTAGGIFRVLYNNGDGTFPPATQYFPPSNPLDVKLRDLNGDGFVDLLWNHDGPPYAYGTALNDGEGGFYNGTNWPVPTCGYFLAEIDAWDLDNDGDRDIVQIENLGCPSEPFSSRRVFFSRNDGNAQFQLANVMVINVSPRGVTAGDFNEDDILDLAITGQPTSILLGNGDLTFTLHDAAQVPGIDVLTADFNNDHHLDLAIAIQRNVAPFIESMAVQLGNGDGTFQPATIYLGSHSPDLAQIRGFEFGDVDGDGDLDILSSNAASNDMSFWANRGDGTFEPHIRYGSNQSPLDMTYADFTGDGIADAATVGGSFPPLSGLVTIVRGLRPAVPGDSDGDGDVDLFDFQVFFQCETGPGGGEPGDPCTTFDFDNDGDVDFADWGAFQIAFTN